MATASQKDFGLAPPINTPPLSARLVPRRPVYFWRPLKEKSLCNVDRDHAIQFSGASFGFSGSPLMSVHSVHADRFKITPPRRRGTAFPVMFTGFGARTRARAPLSHPGRQQAGGPGPQSRPLFSKRRCIMAPTAGNSAGSSWGVNEKARPVHARRAHSFCVYPFRSSERLLFTMRPT